MKSQRKEKFTKENLSRILYIIFAIPTIVFVLMDYLTGWKYAHNLWLISFGTLCIIEGANKWTKKRHWAIADFICGLILFILGIISFFGK